MQLDQTRIAIRERSMLDILDMSLRVCAVFVKPLMICLAAVAIPLMILNWWLIGWIPGSDDVVESNIRYFWSMSALVMIQAPLVSFLVTPMLGHAMFLEEVSVEKIWKSLLQSSVALFSYPIPPSRNPVFLGTLLVGSRGSIVYGVEVWLIFLVLYSVVLRATRPYINEIILLEKNPLRSRNGMTIGKRSAALHTPNSADLMSRFLSGTAVAIFLTLSVIGSLWFMWGMLLFDWEWGPVMLHICFPATLWLIAGYFAVVRFMCYLDLRIRREGWEVELIMRAASTSLTKVGAA